MDVLPAHIGETLDVVFELYGPGQYRGKAAHEDIGRVLPGGILRRRWKSVLPARPTGGVSIRVLHPRQHLLLSSHVFTRWSRAPAHDDRSGIRARPGNRDERPRDHESPGCPGRTDEHATVRHLQAGSGSGGIEDAPDDPPPACRAKNSCRWRASSMSSHP